MAAIKRKLSKMLCAPLLWGGSLGSIWFQDLNALMAGARYLYTPRGGKLLFYEGNTYFVNSRKGHGKARVLWYCSARKARHCPASIHTFHDRVLGQPPVHTHPPKLSTTYYNLIKSENQDDT